MKLNDTKKIKGKFRIKEYKVGTNEMIWQSDWIENLIVTSNNNGINRILKALNGSGNSIAITKAMIGTGSTSVAETDTAMESPLDYNIIIANSEEIDETSVRFDFFIPDAFLPNNTYTRFATFSGTSMFSHAVISPDYEKTAPADVSIEYLFELNNA
jgi:hypothetical protein